MKTGVLIYNSYNQLFNIGDYIQSLAALQFFENVDIFLNREHLNEYNDEDVKVILNGWFMHEPHNWPPSNKIQPLFVAFHINSLAKELLLNEKNIMYLKGKEPIGCRDLKTVELLKENGINAYFSGCLTLTLGKKYKSVYKENTIYFVDPYFNITKDIKSALSIFFNLLCNYKQIKQISQKMYGNISVKKLLKTVFFYKTYKHKFADEVLLSAEYINHDAHENNFKSEIEKFQYAKKLVEKYSKAKFIVTSRIHCALPCLALETPVIYIDNPDQIETSSCRLDGLLNLFNVLKINKNKLVDVDNLPNRINVDSNFRNKNYHTYLINDLISKCSKFAKSNENPMDN